MSRMNWSRPRGGYELEPWRRSYPEVTAPKLDPRPVREHRHLGHRLRYIEKKSGPHAGFYKCEDCNKWLAWASPPQ